jgi:hypothetical protein
VNLCDSIGYVFCNNAEDAGAAFVLPNRTKRDSLKRRVRVPQVRRYADCLLAFPGQRHAETAQASSQSRLVVDGNVMMVSSGDWTIWINFGRAAALARLPGAANLPSPSVLPPLSVRGLRAGRVVF